LWSTRQLIDGIRWRVRVGASWRDVPATYGFWSAVCALFRRWQRAGVRQVVLTALRAGADAAGLVTWDVSVDSMIMRAHRHAAGARKGDLLAESPGGVTIEHGDHALGRPRGGWTTKVHLGCEQGRKPLSIVLAAGQCGDSRSSSPCRAGSGSLGQPVASPEHVPIGCWRTSRARPRPTGSILVVAGSRRPSRARPTRTRTYKQCRTVERGICQLKRHRG